MIWLIAVAAVAVAALIVYRLGHKRLAVVLGVAAGLLAAWLLGPGSAQLRRPWWWRRPRPRL